MADLEGHCNLLLTKEIWPSNFLDLKGMERENSSKQSQG